MDHQQSKLVSKPSEGPNDEPLKPEQPEQAKEEKENIPVEVKPSEQQKEEKADEPTDVIQELTQKGNPLPLLAVLDQVDLYTRTKEGVPLFNLLMNKFLPLPDLLDNSSIKFETDADGRTPLHYAVQADDAKAVQWLLSKGAHNVADKFGNTPVMDAVRLGNKRSFLLCLHYQHINEELPHLGAEYNRVWELRAMLALGLSLEAKDKRDRTPLQVAVENYSYEAVEYLASVTHNYDLPSMRLQTDSKSVENRLQEGYKKSSCLHRALLPLFQKIVEVVMLLFTIGESEYFANPADPNNVLAMQIFIYVGLQIAIVGLAAWRKPKPKSPESIPRLLHEPYFPNSLDHICPSCFNRYHPEKEEHCDACHVCVPKFQQHTFTCINRSNDLVWYLGEFLYAYTLYGILRQASTHYIENYLHVPGEAPSLPYSLVLCLYHIAYMRRLKDFLLLTLPFIVFLAVRQALFCLQLVGMAFMDRTYQQVTRSQDYPHLFRVFKDKAGKLRTREFRIFYRYKLVGGLCVGVRNLLCYFL